jgi:hypothetical protein
LRGVGIAAACSAPRADGVGARIAPIPDYNALRREPAEGTMAHASPIPKKYIKAGPDRARPLRVKENVDDKVYGGA